VKPSPPSTSTRSVTITPRVNLPMGPPEHYFVRSEGWCANFEDRVYKKLTWCAAESDLLLDGMLKTTVAIGFVLLHRFQ
jgi:hypothetical protein